MLDAIRDFRAEIVRLAVTGDTVFVEIHWTGTKADGTPLDVRGVIIAGIREERIAWARLYVDEVEREGADIDAVVRDMAGRHDQQRLLDPASAEPRLGAPIRHPPSLSHSMCEREAISTRLLRRARCASIMDA